MNADKKLAMLEDSKRAWLEKLCRAAGPEHVTAMTPHTSIQPLPADMSMGGTACGFCRETNAFTERMMAHSVSARRWLLETDVDLLQRVDERQVDQTCRTALGLTEAVFPVRCDGVVVDVLWTGRLRDRDMTEAERQTLAGETEWTEEQIMHEYHALPVFSEEQIKKILFMYRRLRDCFEQMLELGNSNRELTHQLVQSERIRSLGTLSSGVAHHFNNLLSVILGYSSYVLNREKLSKEAENALGQISGAAQRGRRLTEELLAFAGSEIEEDRICHVHETLANVMSLLGSQTTSLIRMEHQLAAQHDDVMGPRSSIHQVVFNLLTNAIDSMPDGGSLAVETSNVDVEDEGRLQEYLRIAVMDSGSEIPAEEDVAEAESEEMGLKLTSVYGIVGKLEGTVMISSPPGGERKVEVLLPTASAEGGAGEPPAVREEAVPSVIWVVDDDSTFREMCQVVLSEEGHTVVELSGGREMQKKWQDAEKVPDVIVIDFSMPEYNGLELCEWLHRHGSEVPVVLVSGLSVDQPDIHKAKKMKRIFFLQKPFSFRELSDMVAMAMGESLISEQPDRPKK